jgi:hypothetical protein
LDRTRTARRADGSFIGHSDGGGEFLWLNGLDEIAVNGQIAGFVDEVLFTKSGEQQNGHWLGTGQRFGRLQAIGERHFDVQNSQVGPVAAGHF